MKSLREGAYYGEGKYRIIEILGSGGFGTVYRAEQVSTGQHIALKTVHFNLEDTDEIKELKTKRLKRETALCAELNHPNIVKVIDSGEADDGSGLYTAFEYIPGKNLSEVLFNEGALTLSRAYEISVSILDALAVAHRQGIIHRDLKPANIMISQIGTREQVKILDFGISTLVSDRTGDYTRLTITNEFLGTPQYSSPEQLRGEVVTPRSDIYSWGLLFIECLTGNRPFKTDSVAEIVERQLSLEPVPLPSLIFNHPLGAFFEWVLNKDRDRRAQDALQVLQRLQGISYDGLGDDNGFLNIKDSGVAQNYELSMATTKRIHQHERKQITVLVLSLMVDGVDEVKNHQGNFDDEYYTIFNESALLLEKFGATRGEIVGDRIIMYFGYPVVTGNESRKALRGALELSTALHQKSVNLQSEYNISLQFAMGIHTGEVTIQTLESDHKEIIGLTPAYTGNLCSHAPHGKIYISENTFLLVKNNFECESLNVSGKNIYSVIEEKQTDGIVESSNSTFTGRKTELALMRKHFDEGGLPILIQGEAGIGKSRLLAELVKTIEERGYSFIEFRCFPEGQNSALFPVFEFLKRHVTISSQNSNEENTTLLEEYIKGLNLSCENILPLLYLWFGYTSESYPPPAVSPQKQKDLLLEYLVEICIAECEQNKRIILFEDLHWIDPTSQELIGKLITTLEEKDLFMTLSCRPSFASPWDEYTVEKVVLEKLTNEHIEKIILPLAAEHKLSEETVATMIERSDGIPLFAEELARMFAHSSNEESTSDITIPQTLKELLTLRLDKMGSAKETGQLAAALGRRFDYEVITAISEKDESILLADLDQLVSAEILHIQHRAGNNPHYYFHHALVRDAAYDTLGDEERVKMHKEIAEGIESSLSQYKKDNPFILAQHFANSQSYDKAVEYGTVGSELSLNHFLLDETISESTKALQWLSKESLEQHIEKKLNLNRILMQALMSKYGWADEQVKQYADGTLDTFRHNLSNSDQSAWALATAFVYYFVKSEQKGMRETYTLMSTVNSEINDQGMEATVCVMKAFDYYNQGEFLLSKKSFEEAIRLYDPELHKKYVYLFGFDILAWAKSTLSIVFWHLGDVSKALKVGDEAIEWARELNHMPSLCISLLYNAIVFQYTDDKSKAHSTTSEILTIADKFGLPAYTAYASLIHFWAQPNNESIATSKHIITILESMGCNVAMSYYTSLHADVFFDNGNFKEAIEVIDASINLCSKYEEYPYEAELYRRRGLFLLKYDKDKYHTEAKKNLNYSLDISRKRAAEATEKLIIKTLKEYYPDEDN